MTVLDEALKYVFERGKLEIEIEFPSKELSWREVRKLRNAFRHQVAYSQIRTRLAYVVSTVNEKRLGELSAVLYHARPG